MNWTGEHWQYIVVAAIVLYALWRIVRGLRKVRQNPGTCSGCSLAGQCHDYKADKKSRPASDPAKDNAGGCCCSHNESNKNIEKRSCCK